MTLEELGQATGIGYKHIAAIERGEKVPSFEAIDRLADALRVQVYELFLPYIDDERSVKQSVGELLRTVEKDSSVAAKRFLLVLLPLLRQFEGES